MIWYKFELHTPSLARIRLEATSVMRGRQVGVRALRNEIVWPAHWDGGWAAAPSPLLVVSCELQLSRRGYCLERPLWQRSSESVPRL